MKENQNHAEDLRDKLNQAISETVHNRGNYADDFRHFTRNRKLPMEELIKFLLTMTGGPLNRELYDAGMNLAPSSYIESRKRISYLAFKKILEKFNSLCADPKMLRGYKVYAIDGSTIPLPRNPKSGNYYISESNPKGWNNTHANLMFDILNHVFIDCYMGESEQDSRKAHDEQGGLYSLIYRRKFQQPTIVILDRGYEGFSTIYHLSNIQNLYFVLRVKNEGLQPIKALPMEELDSHI